MGIPDISMYFPVNLVFLFCLTKIVGDEIKSPWGLFGRVEKNRFMLYFLDVMMQEKVNYCQIIR